MPKIETSKRKTWLKRLFVILVILEVCLPSVLVMEFNGDYMPRIAHHGAYEVIGSKKVKRLFIHRENYLILQLSDERMIDYKLNSSDRNHFVTKYNSVQCLWSKESNRLIIEKDTFELKPIAYKELPLLKSDFHWFSDQFH